MKMLFLFDRIIFLSAAEVTERLREASATDCAHHNLLRTVFNDASTLHYTTFSFYNY